MSVLIKGMEMPKNCGECKMHFLSSDSNVCCQITDRIPKIVDRFYDSKIDLDARKKSIMSVKRPEWCPLVDVPTPHGRLVDVNMLINRYPHTAEDFEKAPTVIEAEDE